MQSLGKRLFLQTESSRRKSDGVVKLQPGFELAEAAFEFALLSRFLAGLQKSGAA